MYRGFPNGWTAQFWLVANPLQGRPGARGEDATTSVAIISAPHGPNLQAGGPTPAPCMDGSLRYPLPKFLSKFVETKHSNIGVRLSSKLDFFFIRDAILETILTRIVAKLHFAHLYIEIVDHG